MELLADIKVKLEPGVEITAENKCGFCTNSYCCSYVTEELETPTTKVDFEHMLWQVSHKNVSVYKDDEGWWVSGIYDVRPQICRDHTNDYCEFDSPAEDDFDLYFSDYETLLAYCKKRFKRWKRG